MSRLPVRFALLTALTACEAAPPSTAQSGEEVTLLGLAAQTPHPEGRWLTLPYLMPHNPVHAALLHAPVTRAQRRQLGGQVGSLLIVSGSGDDATVVDFKSTVLTLSTATFVDQNMSFDAFCTGISILGSGRPFLAGGTVYDPVNPANQELGLPDTASYNPVNDTYTSLPPMAHGRWYATPTLLADGRMLVESGWDQTAMNSTAEIYTPGVGWSPEYPMPWVPPFYLRKHLLPDGTVFNGAPETESRTFDPAAVGPANSGWTHAAWTNYGGQPDQYNREYGTSVLLPLSPDDNYDARVLILGGNRAYPTDTTETIDLGVQPLTWQWGPTMSAKRVRMNAVLLPTGEVLALGGASIDLDPLSASLDADLYDPVSNTFSPASTMVYAHLDHSVALLLPDATVWVAGSQSPPGPALSFEQHMEVYQPAYLFDAAGAYAPRPVIVDFPRNVAYGAPFAVKTDATDIASVVLVRPGSVTHSFDADQRLVSLAFTPGVPATRLAVTAPPDANIAPPGYYMIFLVNSSGVPSVATFVNLQ